MRQIFVSLSTILILTITSSLVQAQTNLRSTPHAPISFLNFAPDARHAAMGEAGVASTADVTSTFWNAAALPYNKKDFGVSASYTPWLRNLVDDMWLGYLTGYYKIDQRQAVAFSVNYFNNGELDLRDALGNQMGYFTSKEMSISGTYSRQLSKNFSMGLTMKWINSDLTGSALINNVSAKPARTFAGDISALYKKEYKNFDTGGSFAWSLGSTITNLGGKVSYSNAANSENFLPTNFRFGGGLSVSPDGRNKFNFNIDAIKLMVPTPDSVMSTKGALAGAFSSFSDAQGGFSEELEEVAIAVGAEYWYNNVFAIRAGYFGENKNKGGRRFFTAGAGVHINDKYSIDFAYLIPVTQNSPLAQTLRVSLALHLNKAEKLDISDDN